MNLTAAGIELIKRYEGLRLTAYKCPADVWTIGYGHTSAAGEPSVKKGLKITKAKADEILRADLKKFEDGVRSSLTREIPDACFSACVSLAYNIGLGAWQKSTALKLINKGDFGNVPKAIQLFNKAGGKVSPGLVKRRADEAKMFAEGFDTAPNPDATRVTPDAPKGKPITHSTTNMAATVTAAAGVSAAAKDIASNTNEIFSLNNIWMILIIALILAGAGYIIWKRYLAAKEWAV